ncbi:MAG: hypothetical protein OEW58_05710 [Gammaproteobacteria bacterium]|nr:hypothetical protein [Gammaproteobacteria bacterium]
MAHSNEIQELYQTVRRLTMQCQQLRLAVVMSFFLALLISMPFPLALLLVILLWIQESIWRADMARIVFRLQKLQTGASDIPSLAQWKAEKINIALVQAQAMQPKVLFIYMLMFGIEMTLFGMGFWPT